MIKCHLDIVIIVVHYCVYYFQLLDVFQSPKCQMRKCSLDVFEPHVGVLNHLKTNIIILWVQAACVSVFNTLSS